jgi:hypothetical protein
MFPQLIVKAYRFLAFQRIMQTRSFYAMFAGPGAWLPGYFVYAMRLFSVLGQFPEHFLFIRPVNNVSTARFGTC